MKYINTSVKKVDSLGLISGNAAYTDDLVLNNNTLIIKLLRSPHPFAKIKSINTSLALKLPGVEGVFTHLDVPKTKFTLAGQSYPEPSAYDRRILDEYVRYVGDPVAIIAAEDEKTAEKAMRLIKVEYEILEPLLDFEKALDSKIVIHPDKDFTNFDIGYDNTRNLAATSYNEKPGVDEGFNKSDIIFEKVYRTQPQMHAMMETYRSYSYFDVYGRLTTISSTQIPFHVKRHLSRALEIPTNKIRVIKPRVGGGFGGKQTSICEIYSAFVTLKTGKPSKIIFSRKESLIYSTTRHAMRIKVKIGANRNGIINAIDIDTLSNTGAYGEHAPTVTSLVSYKTFPLYEKVPMRFKANIVYSNTMVAGAFRGYGATQGTFAVESAINELAHMINIDPTEIRRLNLVTPGKTSSIDSGDIKKCIEIGKKLFNWETRKNAREISPGKIRAAGMAVTMQGSGIAGVDTGSATIKLGDRGEFNLITGVTDMGQGCDTVLTQIAAEVLDVPLERIAIYSADTDISPYDPGAYASSGTYVTGNAVIIAAKKMIEEICKTASNIYNTPLEKIEYLGENIKIEENIVSLTEFAQNAISFSGMNQITTTGTWGGVKSPPPFIAGFAEVEVDRYTGEVEVTEFLSVVDCGTPINPNLVKVQVEGGTAQGIGLALLEDIKYDKNGRVISDNLMQYKIPTRVECKNIKVAFSKSFEHTGPFGAKSVGEVVINTPAPAIADAIFKATKKRFRSLPITAEKILLSKC